MEAQEIAVGDRVVGDYLDKDLIKNRSIMLRNIVRKWDKCECEDCADVPAGWNPLYPSLGKLLALATQHSEVNDFTWDAANKEWILTP